MSGWRLHTLIFDFCAPHSNQFILGSKLMIVANVKTMPHDTSVASRFQKCQPECLWPWLSLEWGQKKALRREQSCRLNGKCEIYVSAVILGKKQNTGCQILHNTCTFLQVYTCTYSTRLHVVLCCITNKTHRIVRAKIQQGNQYHSF